MSQSTKFVPPHHPQPAGHDDHVMRIFAHLDHLIVLATDAGDTQLLTQLKAAYATCHERYYGTPSPLLDATLQRRSGTSSRS